ncbi:MAG: D-alanyl-D-alanine carboxypeptidase, partial [Clostridium sp.]
STIDLISGANREYNSKIMLKETISDFTKKPSNIIYTVILIFICLVFLRLTFLSIKRKRLRRRRPRFK